MNKRELAEVLVTKDEHGRHHIVKAFIASEITPEERKSALLEYRLARTDQPIKRLSEYEFIITGSNLRFFTD